MRCILLGVGAMNSPRFAPAGLLVEQGDIRVMLDGGPRAEPRGRLDAWLVTDNQAELAPAIRRLARKRGVAAGVAPFASKNLTIRPKPVVHTSHPAFGYVITRGCATVVWAPEFWKFPRWAKGACLMFAEASAWNRPILFRGRTGGHACVACVARAAKRWGVKRLVFAHIGRPTIRAWEGGQRPEFGEFGADGACFQVDSAGRVRRLARRTITGRGQEALNQEIP